MKRIDRWIFEEYPVRYADLSLYRILYSLFLFLVMLPKGMWIKDAPNIFFNPPLSLAALFTSFPSFDYIVGLNVLLTLAVSALLMGWRTEIASLATSFLLVVLESWCYAMGKIDHGILLVVIPAVFAFSGWGKCYSLDARKKQRTLHDEPTGSWSVCLLALITGLAMGTAGWRKVLPPGRWWDPAIQSSYGHLVANYYITGRHTWAAAMLLKVNSQLLWKSFDLLTVMLEIMFLPAALFRRRYALICAMGCLFHFGVWLLFDIGFSSNVIAYASLVPFSRLKVPTLFHKWLLWLNGRLRLIPDWALLCGSFFVGAIGLFAMRAPLANSLYPGEGITCMAGLFATVYLFRQTSCLIKGRALAQ